MLRLGFENKMLTSNRISYPIMRSTFQKRHFFIFSLLGYHGPLPLFTNPVVFFRLEDVCEKYWSGSVKPLAFVDESFPSIGVC